jgi:hypothetical protein
LPTVVGAASMAERLAGDVGLHITAA